MKNSLEKLNKENHEDHEEVNRTIADLKIQVEQETQRNEELTRKLKKKDEIC